MSTAIDSDVRSAAALDAAHWLSITAAPTFTLMALLTAVHGSGKVAMICGFAREPAWLGGMVPMYLLMGLFHSAPWLRLISSRARRSRSA